MNKDEISEHYLYPGNIFAHMDPHVVTTVLGSCVSVCFWDSKLRVGGINHYMLPLWNGEGLATPKYGNIAITKLYDKMISFGCKHVNLKAKVFGGGEVLAVKSSIMNVGERNIILARDMLKKMKVQIVSSDLGGRTGRKILFNTNTGTVLLKKLSKQVDDFKP
ncbi:chemotaxis protein CheD [Nitrospirota bacterium]